MKWARFSIARLMGFVLVAGLGLAGLKGANEAWAGAYFTLMIVGLTLAILNAAQARGKARAFWAGFAISGWVYFLLIFSAVGPNRMSQPQLSTELLIDRLEPAIYPSTAASNTITFTPMPYLIQATPATPAGPSPLVATYTTISTKLGSMAVLPTNMAPLHYRQIAHSLATLLVGAIGGFYSLWLAGRRERREADLVADLSPSSP